MTLAISPETQKLIESRLASGRYPTPEDVLQAALGALKEQESFGEFEPGELNDLIAEGEASIANEGVIEADTVFDELRQMSAQRRASG